MQKTKEVKKRVKPSILNDKGMAMTEVVIAFLLLTIIFSMLYHCIRFSSNMMMTARDLGDQYAEFEKKAATAFTRNNPGDDPYALTGDDNVSVGSAENISFEVKSVNGSAVSGESHSMQVRPAQVRIAIDSDNSEERTVYLYSTAP